MGCGVGKRQPVPPPRTAAAGTAYACGNRAQERCERAAMGARCGKRGHGRRAMGVRPGGSGRPPAAAARLRRSCTETMRTRGHGMWGGEAPARPSAAHGRGRNCIRLRQSCTGALRTRGHGRALRQTRPWAAGHGRSPRRIRPPSRRRARPRRPCTETMRARGHGMWGGEAPDRPAAAHGRGRNCARRGDRAQKRRERAAMGARCGKRGHGRSPRRIRPPSRSRRTAPPASARRFPEGPAAARKNGARPPHPAVARLPFSLPPRRLRQPCKPRSWRSMFSITTS